jgi:flavin reductase (DIM6/NTAB) family NADH-FMN oxidoreductase RutF
MKYRYGCGDHTLYVGEVQKLAVTDPAAPLLFYAGKYAMLQVSPEPEGAEPYPSFF